MIRFCNNFAKITGWPVQKLCFRTRVRYEAGAEGSRHFRGAAIILSNHTSVYDYAVLLFVFFWRTVRYQMAEVLFEKKALGWFLRLMGGIRVDRDTHDLSALAVSERILRRGGAVGIFPEGRLPHKGETRPLPFRSGAAYLALTCHVPVIPVYTNGSYFRRKRAAVIIGTPYYAWEDTDETLSERENLRLVSEKLRERVISLGKELEQYENEAKAKAEETRPRAAV